MADIIIVLLLVFIVGSAVYYIYKKKKSGAKCIGCPCSDSCSGKCKSGTDKEILS